MPKTNAEREAERIFDEMKVDVDSDQIQEPSEVTPEVNSDEVDTRIRTEKKFIFHHPGIDEFEAIEEHIAYKDGSQLKLVVEPRPYCPNCDNRIFDPEEFGNPTLCNHEDCENWTCHICGDDCSACGDQLCPDHRYGHALGDGPFCLEDVGDVEEKVQYDREMERNEQQMRRNEFEEQVRQNKFKNKKEVKEFIIRIAEKMGNLNSADEYQNQKKMPEKFKGVER